jgi:ribose/xylose/arabinose/galactoside ABC-type transport system permease subunit
VLLICALYGWINCALVNKFNFQAFIATLGMASVVKGIMYFTSVGDLGVPVSIGFTEPVLHFLGAFRLFNILPFPIILTIIGFIIYGFIMSKTKFGLRVYLIGGNPVASLLAGIDPKKLKYILFINCAVLSGVTGVLGAARLMQGSLMALGSSQFTGLTAAILGGISFGGGSGGMGGTFIALIVINTFTTGMSMVNVNPYLSTAFTGVLLLFALSLDYFSNKQKRPTLATR